MALDYEEPQFRISDNSEIFLFQGLHFDVVPSLFDENLNPEEFENPSKFVIEIATRKVMEVSERLKHNGQDYDIIIGADTIVYMEGKIYGKPKNKEDAVNMLKAFSGKSHNVYSGVCVSSKNKTEPISFSEDTKVYFGDIPEEVIRCYVNSGEPLDKAGAYGIQSKGGTLVEKIEGDYFNVVGLPLHRLCKILLELQIDLIAAEK